MQQMAGAPQVRVVSQGGSPIAQRVVAQVPPRVGVVTTVQSPIKGNVASPIKQVLSPTTVVQGASPVRVVQQAGSPAKQGVQVVRVVQGGRTVGSSFQATAPAAVAANGSFAAAAPVRVVAGASPGARVGSPVKLVNSQAKPAYPAPGMPVTAVRVPAAAPQARAVTVVAMPVSQEPESKFPGLRIGAFARVRDSGVDGKISKSNGHAFKLAGKWYFGDELEFGVRPAPQQVEEELPLVKPAATQGCFVGVLDKMREMFSPKAKSSKTTRDYGFFSRSVVQVGGFARVKASGTSGLVSKTNGHAFKVGSKWYLAEELEPTKG